MDLLLLCGRGGLSPLRRLPKPAMNCQWYSVECWHGRLCLQISVVLHILCDKFHPPLTHPTSPSNMSQTTILGGFWPINSVCALYRIGHFGLWYHQQQVSHFNCMGMTFFIGDLWWTSFPWETHLGGYFNVIAAWSSGCCKLRSQELTE